MMVRSRRTCRALAISSALLCAAPGCTVGPNYQKPDIAMPGGWVGPTTRDAATMPTTGPSISTNGVGTDLRQWWTALGDPMLDTLVSRAVESNLDLKQAQSRLLAARAARGVSASALYPAVDSGASYSRSGNGRTHATDLYQAQLDASWELDFFGGVRRDVEAADADVQAAVEDQRDVLVSLTAEVALNYVNLRTFQREIQIARNNLDLQTKSADLTRRKFDNGHGFVGSLDVANADALIASTQSQIPGLETSERQTIYALSVLLGREPGALLAELSEVKSMPTTTMPVPAGLPSELLQRRPDVRRVEAQLHAAVARVGVATADLYPRISLTGAFGTQSGKPASLLDSANQFWSIGPSISWPVFDAGRIRSNIAAQQAAADQSLLIYKATILTALQDVENALIAYDRELEHHRSLSDAVAANRRAVDAATQLYAAGQTDFLNVLSAQRSLFSSEDALVQSDAAVVTDLIALYKALGGGWGEN
jgi:NodT family efflux transporter outer membrane factor (OMF) lipoprotein